MRVLVTGASRGLGAVVVESLKEHTVFPSTRAEIDFLNLKPDDFIPEVEAVIHCAGGGMGLRDPLLSPSDFHKLFMVNLGGAAWINKILIPGMKSRQWGRIVHVCSIASGEAVGSVGYNTVKAALGAYVRSLGREMAPYGVVVSGISPGAFQCPGNAMERLLDSSPKAYAEFMEKRLPRGIMGHAGEIVPLIKFLISEEASMMGGCVVPIDAGEGQYYG